MILSEKLLKKMIHEELKKIHESTAYHAAKYALSGGSGGGSGRDSDGLSGAEAILLGALGAVLVGLLGADAAYKVYKDKNTDYDQLAEILSEVPESEIRIILNDFRHLRWDIRTHEVPHRITNPSEKRKNKQHLKADLDTYASMLANMSKEELKDQLQMSQLRDMVLDYSVKMKDMETPEQQLKIQKDTGSIYRESYKKKK